MKFNNQQLIPKQFFHFRKLSQLMIFFKTSQSFFETIAFLYKISLLLKLQKLEISLSKFKFEFSVTSEKWENDRISKVLWGGKPQARTLGLSSRFSSSGKR